MNRAAGRRLHDRRSFVAFLAAVLAALVAVGAAADAHATMADGSLRGPGVSYDPAGNQKTADCRTNTYDGLDRLVASSGCARPAVSTTYDGLDRQASVTTGGQLRRVRYTGTDDGVLAEEDATPAKTARYLLGPDGAALGVTDSAGGRQMLSTDPQGSTVLAVSGGATRCAARFDPWGDPEGAAGPDNPCQTGSTVNNRWYRQGRRDQTTGTYQMGARTYDPSKAGWLSADSYRASGSEANLSVSVDPLTLNRYAYVNGDPINLRDPDGHVGCSSLPYGPAKKACRKGVDGAKAFAGAAKDAAVEAYRDGKEAVVEAYRDTKEAVVDAYRGAKDFVREKAHRAVAVAKPVARKAAEHVVEKVVKPVAKAAVDTGKFAWRNRDWILAGATLIACGAATVGSAGILAAACGPLVAASLANALGTSAVDNGLLPGGKKADWGAFGTDVLIEAGTALGAAGAGKVAGAGLRRFAPTLRRTLTTTDDIIRTAPNTAGGGGRVFTHFSDEAGATGITGTRPLAVGQSAEVGQLTFGKGNNPFLVGESRIGVTDLGLDATPGQLNGIGVFGPRQRYGIQFSELDAWNSGVRVAGDLPSRNIYSIPGGCTITGTCTVTRLR